MDIRKVAQLAASQSEVVHIDQLYARGLTRKQIRHLVDRHVLYRRFEGVYIYGHPQPSARGRLQAALLAGGEHAFLSGWTAAAQRGIGTLNLNRIEVTVPADHTPKRQPGVLFHRTTNAIDRLEVVRFDGLPTSTIPRILIELSRGTSAERLERLLEQAVHADVFDPFALEKLLERHHRTPGVAKLKRVADYYRPLGDMKSVFEAMFDIVHVRRSDIPPCERNVRLGIWEIDRHWPAQRVCLELDGRRYHTAKLDMEKDRYKDTDLQLMGERPMRVSYWMWVKNPDRQIANLLAMLALTP